jgi:hypothetical protein
MEAASRHLGRVPMKTGNGLEWLSLLDAERVNASVMDRATATNPAAVAKLHELELIREMTATVANVAIAEVKDALTA